MLLVGKSLGWDDETVSPQPGQTFQPFQTTNLYVLEGRESVKCRVGREFDRADLPAEGESVAVQVVVTAKGGFTNVIATARDREVEKRLFGPQAVKSEAVKAS